MNLTYVLQTLAPSNYTVDFVVTGFPSYLSSISAILDTTQKPVLKAYFMWGAMRNFRNYVVSNETKPILELYNIIDGQVRTE